MLPVQYCCQVASWFCWGTTHMCRQVAFLGLLGQHQPTCCCWSVAALQPLNSPWGEGSIYGRLPTAMTMRVRTPWQHANTCRPMLLPPVLRAAGATTTLTSGPTPVLGAGAVCWLCRTLSRAAPSAWAVGCAGHGTSCRLFHPAPPLQQNQAIAQYISRFLSYLLCNQVGSCPVFFQCLLMSVHYECAVLSQ